MLTSIPAEIARDIGETLNTNVLDFSFTGGGCINNGGKLTTSDGACFLKWNDALKYPGMFEAESRGLTILSDAKVIHIPEAIAYGQTRSFQYIVIEFVVSHKKQNDYWENLGRSLARLHRVSSSRFGLDHHNYIGSLRQYNTWHSRWIDFFIEQRLQVQLDLAVHKQLADGSLVNRFESLYKRLPDLLPEEKPALLHGDLWAGNLITNEKGAPCLIDPAVYFGNREMELAFTHLFGGFDNAFYQSYEEAFPLVPGFSQRCDLYNLYPLLVHANLFGSSYIAQVKNVLSRYEGCRV